MKTNAEIAEDILATLPSAATPADMAARQTAADDATVKETKSFRLNLLLLAGMHIEESIAEHPAIDMDAMKRNVANELIHTAAFVVRSLKRAAGEDIRPARFALVAYAIADQILQFEWSARIESDVLNQCGTLRSEVDREHLARTRKEIAALPEDDAIRVECIARTFRNCLSAGGELAKRALKLVSDELAAEGSR